MKKADVVTSLTLVPVDYAMLVASGLTSYALRYQGFVTRYRPVFFEYSFAQYLPLTLVFAAIGLLVFAMNGSYRITTNYRISEALSRAITGVSTTILLAIVTIFLRRELFSSRFVIIIAWVLAIAFVTLGRVIVFRVRSSVLAMGMGMHRLLIIGASKAAEDISAFYAKYPRLGYAVVKTIPRYSNDTVQEVSLASERHDIDEILCAQEDITREALDELVMVCHEHSVPFRYIASLFQTRISNFTIDSIAGYPIIQIRKTPLVGWGRIVKRLLDIVISASLIILLSPLMVIVGIIILVDSRGSAMVGLIRIGRGKRSFTLYKFRSMIPNAHAMKPLMVRQNERTDGPLFKIHNDPRITRVGRILRRLSLDELPQLWNVLLGDMSLIGPRPHEPEEVAQYRPEHRALMNIRPGISGMAQVSGRSNLLFDEEASLDLYYIEHWSLWLDMRIMAKTLFVIFKTRDAA